MADSTGQRDIPFHRMSCPVCKLGELGKGSADHHWDGLGIGQWVVSNFVVHILCFLGFIPLSLSFPLQLLLVVALLLLLLW